MSTHQPSYLLQREQARLKTGYCPANFDNKEAVKQYPMEQGQPQAVHEHSMALL